MRYADTAAVPAQCHTIGFFRDDEQLCREVGAFIAEGLALGQPGLAVTTEAHRRGIRVVLTARGACPDEAMARGDLLLVDAEETLAAIMRGPLPDSELYFTAVGTVVADLLKGRPGPVRIFGDMVDLLWQRQQYEAAIKIEILSNQLAVIHPISVICGYSMGHFLKTAARLEDVRRLHGREHVPADRAPRSRRRG